MMGGVGDRGFTPLCPAGHLPLKGGDRKRVDLRDTLPSRLLGTPGFWTGRCVHPISPLEGEMSGRTEGGVSLTSYTVVVP
ncbi:hypothetical protein J2T09_000414 [Neorhizobium huautlense]|uniref:Lytic murein transglycosylase n=1 Tax=Neorhizobium huautlense TaxID=67774 RepID=A0ABT9PMI1_9HYPH|nr:hypothetical protein [Neorhizobium huautlense]